LSEGSFDRGDVIVSEVEVRRADDRLDLVGGPESGNRAVHRGVAQRPGDRDRPRRSAVSLRDRDEPLDEGEIGGELRLPNAGSRERQSSSGRLAMRLRVIFPVSSPELIGE
jgi:hypothetical protein